MLQQSDTRDSEHAPLYHVHTIFASECDHSHRPCTKASSMQMPILLPPFPLTAMTHNEIVHHFNNQSCSSSNFRFPASNSHHLQMPRRERDKAKEDATPQSRSADILKPLINQCTHSFYRHCKTRFSNTVYGIKGIK